MKKMMILFVFLLLPLVHAQVENYNNVSTLTTHVVVSSSLERTSGTVNELSSSLNFFPKEYGSQILLSQDFLSTPLSEVEQSSDEVAFTWYETSSEYSFSIDSKVQTENSLVSIL